MSKWLEINEQIIYGTSPWERAEEITTEEIGVGFTLKLNYDN